jgi:hypothetical protein
VATTAAGAVGADDDEDDDEDEDERPARRKGERGLGADGGVDEGGIGWRGPHWGPELDLGAECRRQINDMLL